MPRITRTPAIAPHDQRVLAIVGVVAAADASRFEAELLVELDRALVRDAHLECVAAPLVVARHLEEPLEQRRRDTSALVVGIDCDVHHVPRVDVAGVDRRSRRGQLPSNAPRQIEVGFASSEANIERDHGVGYARCSIVSIAARSREVERPDLERDGRHAVGLASGSRTYSGSTSAAAPNEPARSTSSSGIGQMRFVVVGRHRRAVAPRTPRGSEPRRRRRASARRRRAPRAARRRGPALNTSPRRASSTGSRRARRRRASRRLQPARRARARACARSRARSGCS